ncbi:hemerythrin domain-containing protein [Streptomyces sp. NBC_01474]|uniref:hemerythrin domain-containing protein n=1 Tax=Streptomyces sp. NBC_01474 TaxID=2903880 RepID=UPI002DD84C55|nr:hemerythrin domain-containing protein [Streptomyces sp. NBC_01474]WSE01322.1 hemerythrin domain-containing protein [Streptomyces sp. NBC_01474]
MTELTVDHREVDELFIRIEAQPARDTRRRELVDELTVELVRHSVAEEQYLYPAVREHVDGGDALADKELEDHAEAERLLKDLVLPRASSWRGVGPDQAVLSGLPS